jgi:ribosomal protein S14
VTADIAPDSRLQDRNKCTRMGFWDLPDGSQVWIEQSPVYCPSCGKFYGWVPKDNTTFSFWLCRQCFEDYGAIAGTLVSSDEDFCRNVEYEMMNKFGGALTDLQFFKLSEHDDLGTALTKLAKESPYKVYRQP